LEPLNLTLGDDLQKNYRCQESTAKLFGALSELRSSFDKDDSTAQKLIWLEKDKKGLAL
jgi:hypothetical protein